MEIGAAIRTARKQKGWAERELAAQTHLSRSAINHLEHGRRPVKNETLRLVNTAIQDFRLGIASVEHVTGGVFGVALDGLDGSPAMALTIASAEIEDAMAALADARRMVAQCVTKVDQENVINVALEVMEATAALNEFLAAWSHKFNLQPEKLVQRLHARLLHLGYRNAA